MGAAIVAGMDADTTHEWARLALLRMLARDVVLVAEPGAKK